jgi:hypothetical protein
MPVTVPADGPEAGTQSHAEKTLYWLFRRRLGSDFRVLHSVPWHAKEGARRPRDGEMDFVVIHPLHGILVLEVKGGSISFTSRPRRRWSTTTRVGRTARIKDPFLQASLSAHVLYDSLHTFPLTQPFANHYRVYHGVWFPDIEWTPTAVPAPHVQDALVLDRRDLDNPEAGLLRVYRHYADATEEPHQLSDTALQTLMTFLAPEDIAIRAGDDPHFRELTLEQLKRLQAMHTYRRLFVPGSAGTGKTVLAIEKAWRLAEAGSRTLLLCSNPLLADWMRSYTKKTLQNTLLPSEESAEGETKQGDDGLLTICDIRDLCRQLATRAQIALPENFKTLRVLRAKDQVALGRLLTASIKALKAAASPYTFDAILVDEGQDIDQPLWTPLLQLRANARESYFYVFYDEQQRDLQGAWRKPNIGAEAVYWPLVENIRNTQAIFRAMQTFCPALKEQQCLADEGAAIVFIDPHSNARRKLSADAAEEDALRDALDLLIQKQGIAPTEVLVITCRTQEGSRWFSKPMVGAYKLRRYNNGMRDNMVPVLLVRSAKGLEHRCVIISELDGADSNPKREKLLYTAMSRAREQLIVLGRQKDFRPRQLWLW